MMAPRVSVVIPCYNHGAYIQETIACVRAQTFEDHEIILVNDGSTDPETNRIIDALSREGIKVFRTPNRGPAAARNSAIAQSRGEFILPLDADDRIAPRYLELAVAAMDRHPHLSIVCGRVEFFGERSGEWPLPEFSLTRLLVDNMLVATSLFRRNDWKRAGGYREDLGGWEDWDFWLAVLSEGGTVERIEEVLFYYRIRNDSRDRSLGFKKKLNLMLKMVMRHRKLYLDNWKAVLRHIQRGETHGRQI